MAIYVASMPTTGYEKLQNRVSYAVPGRYCANEGGTTGVPLVPAMDEGIFFERQSEEQKANEDKAALSRKQLHIRMYR